MAFKVIQMGLGSAGHRSAEVILQKKSLELVGAVDVNPELVGRDIGDAFKLGRTTGVRITKDLDAALATPADIVMHMVPTSTVKTGSWQGNVDEILRIVATRKNVMTTTGAIYSWKRAANFARQIDEAAKENGVTVMGAGCNPGYMSEVFPLIVTGGMINVERMSFSRGADHTMYDSIQICRETLGYGLTREEFMQRTEPPTRKFMESIFIESIDLIAHVLEWEIDDFRSTLTPFLAGRDMRNICIEIKKGTVCAETFHLEGLRDGDPVITMEWSGILSPRDMDGKGPQVGEHIVVEGYPSTRVEFLGDHPAMPLEVTAAVTTNYIPLVVAAHPGLRTMIEVGVPVLIP